MGQASPIIRGPIADAIRSVVARHLTSGHILSASDVAEDILQTCPGSGMAVEDLANHVMVTAASAGVPVKIGHYGSGDMGNPSAHRDLLSSRA